MKTHNVVVKYIVMEDRRGEAKPFSRFREDDFETEEAAEQAIVKFIEQADGFAGCPDLWVRKVFHAEYIS